MQVVGEKAGAEVFERGTQDPVKTSQEAIRYAKDYGFDFVLIDTAGRLQIDEKLMDELKRIREAVTPTDILLVVDAMTGQEAVNVAKTFDELLDISGVILTKLDGDTRGGAALSIRAVTGKPIKFTGVGEKIEDLEAFHPDRMASRILGMGDVLSLIEEAQSRMDEKAAREAGEKMMQNRMDLNDLLSQFETGQENGSAQGNPEQNPRCGKTAEKCGRGRPHGGPDAGDYPFHDAGRTGPPADHQPLPQKAYCRRQRDEGGRCQPPAQAV